MSLMKKENIAPKLKSTLDTKSGEDPAAYTMSAFWPTSVASVAPSDCISYL